MNAVAPVLKIRTVLRERTLAPISFRLQGAIRIDDDLMLGWAEEEVTARKDIMRLTARADAEFAELKAQAVEMVNQGAEISNLNALLFFTKIESARGLVRQAHALATLCCLVLILAGSLSLGLGSSDQTARRAKALCVRRLVRTRKNGDWI